MRFTRREFCAGVGAVSIAGSSWNALAAGESAGYQLVAGTDRSRILKAAKEYIAMPPVTITAFPSAKSPGGPHDFFSESDYFWPDPRNPDGPYINRDGQSNPGNFNEHRKVMVDLSIRMPALTAAWLLVKDPKYAKAAGAHLVAWFVTPATRMNPNLQYAQGVHGLVTGRSYGIIDTLHLVEVTRAASLLGPEALSVEEKRGVQKWFREYLDWMKTSAFGQKERAALNNHATCWALQASEYARLIGDEGTREEIR